jgi:S1-C subfamily serine protease
MLALPAARAKTTEEVSRDTMPGVVQVIAADFQGKELVPVASGSGTIITADGSVLTNHHVIYDKDRGRLRDVAAIALLRAYDEPPDITCLAVPSRGIVRADLDLALLKCETDLQGKPYSATNWPTVAVGDSGALIPGSSVLIFGYPGVGGPTINMTSGHVSGFLGKEGGAGRFWIKTDAAISHGNSGGTAVDKDGLLVGIPTAVKPGESDPGERVGLLRPAALAIELVDAARNGWHPADAVEPRADTAEPDPSGCETRTGVTLSGRIVAADNGKPVQQAFVILLRPGVKRSEIAEDYSNIAEKYAGYAVTDGEGRWQLPCPLAPGRVYGAMILATGYVELSSDEALSTDGLPTRYEPWGGKVALQRN